jgi:hypothetical protein
VGKRRAKIKPIFVDGTGRRRKVFTVIAAAAGVLLTSAAAILIAGFFGAGPSSLPGLPDLPPAQQEVARVPEPPSSPVPSRLEGAPGNRPSQNGTNQSSSVSTSDTRGNGNGNRPTRPPNHPQPTKSR